MNDRDRLTQLQALRSRLARIPASPERDWMLAEVRGRAVDVDTGVQPAALRRLPQSEAEAELPARPAPVAPARQRTPPPPPQPHPPAPPPRAAPPPGAGR